ncbi:hypothetical protein BHU72_09290 [Desulfuribacillus stibiiarsenatis]|uniref:HTH lysR-type domain-containing protein n=1 Tax=Desulfuribacillus stibiiarsenatis TaxID=1390249 RepID=A0A1E5L2W6_9FIRM|nr:LysR substrate-binding domain-containing protein [Desulfuribacillus stibiiarsenatis]OEH84403.1 hypothetical protein BHU72_09290 [Desulfuribacillus stibiiarsenatis]
MRFDQLKIFKEAADLQSFSKAGKKLHLTQPGVSSQINSLEKTIGIPLFDRHTHGVSLTEIGQIVYNFSVDVFDLHKKMEQQIDAIISSSDVKKITIGSTHILGTYYLPLDILDFEKKYPHITVELKVMDDHEVLTALKEKKIDIAFIEGPVQDDTVDLHLLAFDELVLVASKNDPVLDATALSNLDFKKGQLLMLEKSFGISKTLLEGLEQHTIDLHTCSNVKSNLSNIHSLKIAINAIGAFSFLPRITVQNEIRFGILEEFPMPQMQLFIPYWAATLKESHIPIIGTRFIQFFSLNQNHDLIKDIQTKIPCWELTNCSIKYGGSECEVYKNQCFPCWTVKGTPCKGPSGLDTGRCHNCEVYLKHGENRPILITQFR